MTARIRQLLISSLTAVVLLCSGTARADLFFAPVPDLIGELIAESSGLGDYSFEFETEFEQISRVWLEMEATATPFEYDKCGTIFDPQPCEHMVVAARLVAILDEEDFPVLGTFLAGIEPFGDISIRRESEFCGNPILACHDNTEWEFLLDGGGSFLLGGGTLFFADALILNMVLPTFQITDANIIVEAVPVPEPSSVVCAWTALLVLAGLRCWSSRSARWRISPKRDSEGRIR